MQTRFIRPAVIFLLIITTGALLVSFRAARVYSDIWQELGLTKEKGQYNIRESFLSGYLHYYGVRNVKSILTGDKAAIARDLMQFAKQEIGSESFRQKYEQMRKGAKPQEPVIEKRSKEDLRKEKIQETEKSIRDTEENIKKMSADIAKALKPMLEVLHNNLKDYKDPKSQMIDLFYQSELMQNEGRQRSYEEDMKKWEQDYPADCRQLIRARLQRFIDLAKTVDFNAALKDVNGKKKFVNPVYEGKPYDWKQIYRAGKDVIDPAVIFATQWIKELQPGA
jgi:F0F1-type ATP synthase membrane subunit b/b'